MGKWWVLFAMCLIMAMLSIDATALNIAIPVIAHEFYADLASMQWVVNGFFLFAAMVQIIGGHLGDAYGHKKNFLINVALFLLSSLGAGLSTDETMLIIFRAFQGASVGIAYPTTIVLLFTAFPKEQQSYARSFIVATMGIFLAVGAPLGGLFVNTIGWRWIFFINLPIGLLALFLTWKYCPRDGALLRKKLDFKGTTLLVLGLFFFTLSLNQAQNWGFLSPLFFSSLIGGLALLYFLYLFEKHKEEKLVDFHLFYLKNFTLNSAIRIVTQIIFTGMLFFIPLYLQNIMNFSALTSGFLMLSLTFMMSIFSPIAGKWVDRTGDKTPNIVSMSLFLLVSILFLFLTNQPNLYLLSFTLFLSGIPIAITYISTTTGALSIIPDKKIGSATGLLFTIIWLACALGVAISGTSIALKSAPYLHSQLEKEGVTLTAAQFAQTERAARGISPVSTLSPQLEEFASESFVQGLHYNAIIFAVLSAGGLVLSLFLTKRKPLDI